MKKVFYICTKPIENWDIFAPSGSEDTQRHTSLLLLHQEQDLENVSVSHVWNLKENEQNIGNKNTQETISYQNFLEQIFSHDLSVVV